LEFFTGGLVISMPSSYKLKKRIKPHKRQPFSHLIVEISLPSYGDFEVFFRVSLLKTYIFNLRALNFVKGVFNLFESKKILY
jgi:hypothetical protein